jgi:hypothetical protein
MCTAAHKHYPECVCEHCEKHQTGFFAQRNFLAGDDEAGALGHISRGIPKGRAR